MNESSVVKSSARVAPVGLGGPSCRDCKLFRDLAKGNLDLNPVAGTQGRGDWGVCEKPCHAALSCLLNLTHPDGAPCFHFVQKGGDDVREQGT